MIAAIHRNMRKQKITPPLHDMFQDYGVINSYSLGSSIHLWNRAVKAMPFVCRAPIVFADALMPVACDPVERANRPCRKVERSVDRVCTGEQIRGRRPVDILRDAYMEAKQETAKPLHCSGVNRPSSPQEELRTALEYHCNDAIASHIAMQHCRHQKRMVAC